MTTVGTLLRRTEGQLARAGIGDARLEAELVWMTALEIDRTHLYAQLRDEPPPRAISAGEALIDRRLRHEPAAYLMGRREFYGLELFVAPGVLIPRQETETIVEEALRLLKARGTGPVSIADIGCGCGAIAIALAVNAPEATIYATDAHSRPLEVTRLNAERCGVAGRVRVLGGDLLAPLPGPVDLIAANLPYVASADIPLLEPEVSGHEPREALDGGADGMALIRALISGAPRYLLPGGALLPGDALLMEMDPRQVTQAAEAAHVAFPQAQVRAVQDLAKRDRVLVVET